MFAKMRRLLGLIEVTETNDIIKIEGLPADVISKDIKSYWETGKINANMFNTLTPNSLSFHSFFAPDFAYTLNTLINDHSSKKNIRALKKVLEELFENTWLKKTREEQPNILNIERVKELNVNLLPHQVDFLKIYNHNVPKYNLNGFLLGAAPGTGKTITCLALGLALEADIVIGIVPKNAVIRVWEDTVKTKFKRVQSYWHSLQGKPPMKGKKYYFFHYEQLDKAIAFVKTISFTKPLIILDESHNFNEMDSNRTKMFIELCKITKCENVVWSSGTLIKAIGGEAMPMFATLDKLFTPGAQFRFSKIYGKASKKAVDILRHRLGLMTFKVDKKAVVDTKPHHETLRIKIPNGEQYTLDAVRVVMKDFIIKQMEFYQKNMKDYVKFYDSCLTTYENTISTKQQKEQLKKYKEYVRMIQKGYDPVAMKEEVIFCNKFELKEIIPTLTQTAKPQFKAARSVVKYYYLKVQGEALGRILGKKRVECNVALANAAPLENIIDNALSKTILFTSFVEVVDSCYKKLTDSGYLPVRVYGETNKDLANIVSVFEKKEDINPLIATLKSLSSAVPLIMANTIIMLNSPFRHYELEQAVARVDRLGQEFPVFVIHVLLDTGDKPNISTRSNDILKWSEDMVSEILGTQISSSEGLSLENFDDFVEGCENENMYGTLVSPMYVNWN